MRKSRQKRQVKIEHIGSWKFCGILQNNKNVHVHSRVLFGGILLSYINIFFLLLITHSYRHLPWKEENIRNTCSSINFIINAILGCKLVYNNNVQASWTNHKKHEIAYPQAHWWTFSTEFRLSKMWLCQSTQSLFSWK